VTNASEQVGECVAVAYDRQEQVGVALVGRRTRTCWPWSKCSGSARRGTRDWEVRAARIFTHGGGRFTECGKIGKEYRAPIENVFSFF
jgi:hypothetical protein